jgi:UDP-N-acetyl-D-glucosamine dehydrogenase
MDAAAQRLACGFYAQVFEQVVPVSSPEIAEASKLLENTFRAVNIALVNEVKQLCDRLGVNVWEVLDAASTKPFGFLPFAPGPGVGGHCIPIDPQYLRWISSRHGLELPLVATALAVNAAMADHLLARIAAELNSRGGRLEGSRIAVLGVAYKPDIDDVRESPALRIIASLKQAGAQVTYHDPLVPSVSLAQAHGALQSAVLDVSYLKAQDCVLLMTAHSTFDADFIVKHSKLVFDTRNATRKVAQGRERIVLS